ncbi:MAG TPA: hypothetical protein VMF62_00020 [Acetobacteraceae bacterium]|jgi:hypothetical protein|nr:hypothetical protein [Acetobacteraceae bacterium]
MDVVVLRDLPRRFIVRPLGGPASGRATLGTQIRANDRVPDTAGEIWTGTGQNAASAETVYAPARDARHLTPASTDAVWTPSTQ